MPMLCFSFQNQQQQQQSMAPLTLTLILLLFLFSHSTDGAGVVGVNYGQVANNLPSPSSVVQLLQSQGIQQVKLYDADPTILRALANTNIKVAVALPNENLTAAAASPSFALSWINRNVVPFFPSTQIHAIAVGNEVFAVTGPNKNLTSSLVPAMTNLLSALTNLSLSSSIKISSPIALTALSSSYPSSSGAFRPDLADSVMRPMLDLLRRSNSYLMVNAYPFFAYSSNADVISLDYALFRPNPGVLDPASNLRYYSLFDAQIDAVFAAMSALDYSDVRVVVSETGWPSKGDPKETGAGEENAAAYNGNLVRRVLSGNGGTPMRPKAEIDVYLFALFNEDQKPGPASERNYGLFYPNEEKVYDVEFMLKSGSGGNGGIRWQEDRGRRNTTTSSGSGSGSGRVRASSTGETWCVANAVAGKEKLQAALDYACGEGGATCKEIQPGAACYEPNTVEAHASFAFNSYYQKKGRAAGTCDFQGAAYVVSQAPEIGKCDLPTRA